MEGRETITEQIKRVLPGLKELMEADRWRLQPVQSDPTVTAESHRPL